MAQMKANRSMADALAKARQREREDLEEATRRADAADTRAHIRQVVDRENPAEVEEVERGPTRILNRDGLLWLVAKKRLTTAQRMAAERYRTLYCTLFQSPMRSCLADATGGSGTDPIVSKTFVRQELERARGAGLHFDQGLVWLVDQVAGEGATLRDLGKGDKDVAARLEAELLVALRLLARHWGYAT